MLYFTKDKKQNTIDKLRDRYMYKGGLISRTVQLVCMH